MKKRIRTAVFILICLAVMSLMIPAFAAQQDNRTTKIFDDVKSKDLSDTVDRLYEAGIMSGISENTFDPTGTLTRAQFMTILGRASGAVVDQNAPSVFADVVQDGWSSGYISWGVENGLIVGYNKTTFGPTDAVTQEQVNLILERYNNRFDTQIKGYPAPSGNANRGNIAILMAAAFTYEDTAPVQVTGGTVTGYYTQDGEIAIYKGIPYAAPPVGSLRWRAPQPVAPWSGVRRCVNWSASAIQAEQTPFWVWTPEFIIEDTGYSEDCLYLNVWSKDDGVKDKPVIVYIHGGGFTSGGSSCEVYNGESLAREGVVFVNINYRVGAFGYLATSALSQESELGVSGNYGLLDQVVALQWVQDNISQFGGDSENVTVMGQSAGAGSVNALIQSPLATGLFHKAVSESFNDINSSWITLRELKSKNDAIWSGYTLEEMRAMTPDEIISVDNSAALCNDGYALSGNFAQAIVSGQVNDVPLMSGMVTGDALLFGIGQGASTMAEFETALQNAFGDKAKQVLDLYHVTEENAATVASEFNSDNMIALQDILAQARKKGCKSDTYLYFFTHAMPDELGGSSGAFHTSDVPYFLNIFSDLRDTYWTEDDYMLGQTASSYLLNFAKTGSPNANGLSSWNSSDGDGAYLQIDIPCSMQQLSMEKRDLFATLYGDYLN